MLPVRFLTQRKIQLRKGRGGRPSGELAARETGLTRREAGLTRALIVTQQDTSGARAAPEQLERPIERKASEDAGANDGGPPLAPGLYAAPTR